MVSGSSEFIRVFVKAVIFIRVIKYHLYESNRMDPEHQGWSCFISLLKFHPLCLSVLESSECRKKIFFFDQWQRTHQFEGGFHSDPPGCFSPGDNSSQMLFWWIDGPLSSVRPSSFRALYITWSRWDVYELITKQSRSLHVCKTQQWNIWLWQGTAVTRLSCLGLWISPFHLTLYL